MDELTWCADDSRQQLATLLGFLTMLLKSICRQTRQASRQRSLCEPISKSRGLLEGSYQVRGLPYWKKRVEANTVSDLRAREPPRGDVRAKRARNCPVIVLDCQGDPRRVLAQAVRYAVHGRRRIFENIGVSSHDAIPGRLFLQHCASTSLMTRIGDSTDDTTCDAPRLKTDI